MKGPGEEVVIQWERLGWKLASGLERCVSGSVICSGPISSNLAYPTQGSDTHSQLQGMREAPWSIVRATSMRGASEMSLERGLGRAGLDCQPAGWMLSRF